MIAKFVQNFVHFKRGENGLDEDSRANAALWNAQLPLREHKDIVPQPCLKMAFELRQIEIRSCSCRQQFFSVVKEVKAKVKQSTGHRLAVDQKMALVEMPASRTHKQHRRSLVELVALAGGGIGKGDGAAHRVHEVALSFDLIRPGWRIRILKVRHEHARTRIQRVDNHLSVYRTRNFHPSVLQIGGN